MFVNEWHERAALEDYPKGTKVRVKPNNVIDPILNNLVGVTTGIWTTVGKGMKLYLEIVFSSSVGARYIHPRFLEKV